MSTRICPTGAVDHRRWFDYRIYEEGGNYYAEPGTMDNSFPADLAPLGPEANNLTLLQAAWDALPNQEGGNIWVDGDFTFNGTLLIVGSRRHSLMRNSPFKTQALAVAYIRDIDMTSATGVIADHYFEGFEFSQIRFNADTNSIRNITFNECQLNTSNAANERGILLDGTGLGGAYVDGIKFYGMRTGQGNNTAGEGSLMTVRGGASNVGNSLWTFSKCRLRADVAGRFIHIQDGGYIDRVLIGGHTSFEPCTGAQVILYVAGQNSAFRGGSLKVTDCTIELNQNATLFETPAAGSNSLATWVEFYNNVIGCSAGDTLTLANNLNNMWMGGGAMNGRCGFSFHHNRCLNTGGTFAIGTLGEYDDFDVLIKDNMDLNPLGLVANKFDNVSNLISFTSGTVAVPTASTDYTVVVGGVTIYTADSADNNVALMLKDRGGNNLWTNTISPNAFPNNEFQFFAPWGCVVNWGAFTGVMGAVDVGFE